MIVLGLVLALALFAFLGWAVSTEMFQQRAWRRRVEAGDVGIVAALIEEALGSWRRARPPKGVDAALWAGVQAAQLVAVTGSTATVSAAAEPGFRTVAAERVQVTTALEAAMGLAARLADMLLYDVPNLRLASARVDVYTTFTGQDPGPTQRPILSVEADRTVADAIAWEAMTPEEVLGRFGARFERGPGGQGLPIELNPIEGVAPDHLAQPGEMRETV